MAVSVNEIKATYPLPVYNFGYGPFWHRRAPD